MNVECEEASNAISICKGFGVDIKEVSTGWSSAKVVVDMAGKLSKEMREKIENAEPELEYWIYKGSPHNQADEGFKCNRCGTVVSFKK